MAKDALDSIRARIDSIDQQILELIGQRADLAREIGEVKKSLGGALYVPTREKEVLNRLVAENHSPLPQETVRAIFREIISACRSLEVTLSVAFMGPSGSYHHQAALKHFGSQGEFAPTATVTETFREVEKGKARYGVVALENSTEGVVAETMDQLVDTDLRICAEVYLEIHHQLISNSAIEEIRRVYSHPQALAQCRRWLEHNLPQAEVKEVSSTTRGVLMTREEPGTAAISSELSAHMYDVHIVAKNIEDQAGNTTRFAVIGRENGNEPTGHDKTSVVLFVRDRPGALYDCLFPFKERNINLTRIESRPTKKHAWEYIFFVDFHGHLRDTVVQEALEEIEARSLLVKRLGSYPAEHGKD